MDFFSIVLLVLGIFVLCGIGGMVTLVFVGRRLLLSWKKPYKRAIDSLQRLSHPQLSFFQEFVHHPLFYQWFRTRASHDIAVLAVLLCAGDEHTRKYVFSSLSKEERRKLHTIMKQKRSFTSEDMNRAAANIRSYLEDEYQHPTKKLDLSFYAMYFYEEYFQVLTYIQKYKRTVRPELQDTLEKVIISVLHSIPYYRERRLYEQQHKLEMFLTKDIPDMLALISQLPPLGRSEKEEELTLFLQEFRQEVEEAETSMFASVERELNVKMRAAKRKFHTP